MTYAAYILYMLKVNLYNNGECKCCSEVAQMMAKRSSEGVECITLYPGF